MPPGVFREIPLFRAAQFADFGKRRTSFGNMGRFRWRPAAFIVSFGHEHNK
jgi:hypothetical protein